MELLLSLLLLVWTPLLGDIVKGKVGLSISKVLLGYGVIMFITLLSYFVPYYYNNVVKTTLHDVKTYKNITYFKPKTVNETKVIYPTWSIRNDSVTHKVVD